MKTATITLTLTEQEIQLLQRSEVLQISLSLSGETLKALSFSDNPYLVLGARQSPFAKVSWTL